MKIFYFVAAILGAVLPLSQFIPFLKDSRIRSKTLLHLLVQQQRVRILWDGCYRVFGRALDIRLLRGSTTWNEASVDLCCEQFGSRSFFSAASVSAVP